jgi:hypothetical protein
MFRNIHFYDYISSDLIYLIKRNIGQQSSRAFVKFSHFIIQIVEDDEVELQYCTTQEQTVDIFTKPLGPNKFVKFRNKLGVLSKMTIKRGC